LTIKKKPLSCLVGGDVKNLPWFVCTINRYKVEKMRGKLTPLFLAGHYYLVKIPGVLKFQGASKANNKGNFTKV
jgi:hypothetical protein